MLRPYNSESFFVFFAFFAANSPNPNFAISVLCGI